MKGRCSPRPQAASPSPAATLLKDKKKGRTFTGRKKPRGQEAAGRRRGPRGTGAQVGLVLRGGARGVGGLPAGAVPQVLAPPSGCPRPRGPLWAGSGGPGQRRTWRWEARREGEAGGFRSGRWSRGGGAALCLWLQVFQRPLLSPLTSWRQAVPRVPSRKAAGVARVPGATMLLPRSPLEAPGAAGEDARHPRSPSHAPAPSRLPPGVGPAGGLHGPLGCRTFSESGGRRACSARGWPGPRPCLGCLGSHGQQAGRSGNWRQSSPLPVATLGASPSQAPSGPGGLCPGVFPGPRLFLNSAFLFSPLLRTECL